MTKKIISVLALVLMLVMTSVTSFATEGEVLPQAKLGAVSRVRLTYDSEPIRKPYGLLIEFCLAAKRRRLTCFASRRAMLSHYSPHKKIRG